MLQDNLYRPIDVPISESQRIRIQNMVRHANSYAKRRKVTGKLSSHDVARLLFFSDWRCIYCLSDDEPEGGRYSHLLGIDHLRPITRNGSNTIDNLVPCCDQCNKRKDMKHLYAWLQTIGLDKGEFLIRYNSLRLKMGAELTDPKTLFNRLD